MTFILNYSRYQLLSLVSDHVIGFTSVFYGSVLLLIVKFVITLSIHEANPEWIRRVL